MAFTEEWYADGQAEELQKQYERVRELEGRIIEIGCWEGKSTVVLANSCYPEVLTAVDWWLGNLAEGPDHVSVRLAQTRDVFAVFTRNLKELTRGNVEIQRRDCFEFLVELRGAVKFCHIDASHDYTSVRRTIEMLLPLVVPGGVLCGDDYLNAHAERRDLDGGVERACRELLVGHWNIGNLWVWRKESTTGSLLRGGPPPASGSGILRRATTATMSWVRRRISGRE